MIVYRVQNKYTAKGPFFEDGWLSSDITCNNYHACFISRGNYNSYPFIQHYLKVKGLSDLDLVNTVYCVLTIKSLYYWFNSKEVRYLLCKSKFYVYKYEVENNNLIIFDNQAVIINRYKAKQISEPLCVSKLLGASCDYCI